MELAQVHGITLLTTTAKIPTKGSPEAAGYDLYSTESGIIYGGKRALLSLGITISFARGWYGQIFPRSGLAYKSGIQVMGGVIDNDYRGEVKALLYNTEEEPFTYNEGDRVAQLVMLPYCRYPFVEMEQSETRRGTGGFGSTGK